MKLPEGHQVIMPYLMLNGALDFIEFTKAVFNAEVSLQMHQMRPDYKTVMHSEIRIGGSTIMFSDATEQWKEQVANLFIYVENADDTFKRAVELGAEVVMELSDQSYGRTCGVKDPFGNTWWIAATK
jgi:PhnB protein